MISDFIEDHTTTKVSFKVALKPTQLSRMKQGGLEKAFRLHSTLQLTNMNAFDANGGICKFKSAESIADSYFPTRLSLYHDRKSVLQSKLEHLSTTMRNKARFIQLVSEGKIDLLSGRMSKDDSYSQLSNLGFTTAHELQEIKNNNSLRNKDYYTELANEGEERNLGSDFDYLLKMPLSSLTQEKIEELTNDASKAESNLRDLKLVEPEELWLSDLEKLTAHL